MYKKAMLLSVVCVYLFSIKATSAMDYALPFAYAERVVQYEEWERIFEEKLTLLEDGELSYDNTVIWVFADNVDGEQVLADWQVLYALPEGFGVNCCYADYVKEHFGQIKSRYILMPKGSELEAMCMETGHVLIGEDARVCVYMLRDSYEQINEKIVEEMHEEGKQSVFFSTCPLLEDEEETFEQYRGVSVVARDLSRLTAEAFSKTLRVAVESVEVQDLFLWMSPELMNEEIYATLTDLTGVNKEFMLYVPELKTLATWEDSQRQAYYAKIREMVNRLSAENAVLFWLGDQEWFVANDLNYTLYGTMNHDVEEHILVRMHCDRYYVIEPSNVEEKIKELEQYVQDYREGYYDHPKHDADTYVFFGDSIVGNNKDSTSIPEVVRQYTNAKVWNQAVGGTCASADDDKAVSGYMLVEDFVKMQKSISNPENVIFFLNFGLNDYMSGRMTIGTGSESYEGALCRMIETIQKEYEGSEIVLISPSFISYFDCGESPTGSNGNVLKDFVSAAEDVANRYGVHFFDAYHEMGVNKKNADDYLVDMVHHTEQGRFLFARYICEKMEEVIYE